VCVCARAHALWCVFKGLVDMYVDLDDMLSALHNYRDMYSCVCVCETERERESVCGLRRPIKGLSVMSEDLNAMLSSLHNY